MTIMRWPPWYDQKEIKQKTLHDSRPRQFQKVLVRSFWRKFYAAFFLRGPERPVMSSDESFTGTDTEKLVHYQKSSNPSKSWVPPHQSRARDHLRSSHRGQTYCGAPEKKLVMLSGPESTENLEIKPNFVKCNFCWRKNWVETKPPDGPRDELGHWRVSFGHEKSDGKGPKAWNNWK